MTDRTWVDIIENDPTISEEDKARCYAGTYDLYLADLASRDAARFDIEDIDYDDLDNYSIPGTRVG